MSFLNAFVDSLVLKDHHRQELKQKRGLSDETIDKLKFKSCGFYIVELVHEAFADFESALNQHQIKQGGFVNKQLLEDRILIPYIERDGEITKIRPHKLGFKGDGASIYCPALLHPGRKDLIITEGEFKAAAGYEIGLNIVAIPGIQSFIKTRLSDLEEFLHIQNIESVTILFDREIKDDPKLANFKKNWRSRHDTEISAYVMAEKLHGRVAEFPDSWMDQGKCDVDHAVGVRKKTLEDFNTSVLKKAMEPQKYLDLLKERYKGNRRESWHVVKRCLRMSREPNVKKGECYEVLKKRKNGDQEWVKVSNFVIDIESQYFDTSDLSMKRMCRLRNESDDHSAAFDLKPDMITSRQKFRSLVVSFGSFMFTGSDQDLDRIFEYEWLYADVESTIVVLDHCGHVKHPRLEGFDIWLFKNIAFVNDLEILPDDDGVFWLDNEKNLGVKINPSASLSNEVPEIDLKNEFDFIGFHKKFLEIAGNQNGPILLGWAVHCLIVDYLGLENAFPWAFLYGKSGEGKTTLCNIMMKLFGLKDMGVGLSGETHATIQRIAAFYSSMPVWFDEYHNKPKVEAMEPLFKSFYNHKDVTRADRTDPLKRVSYKVRANLLLSGETTPTLDGVRNRGVMLHVFYDKGDSKKNQVAELMRKNWTSFIPFVLRQRHKISEAAAGLITDVGVTLAMDSETIHHRLADIISRFTGCYEAIWGKNDAYNALLFGSFARESSDNLKSDQISDFWECITILWNQGKIDSNYVKILPMGELAVNLKSCYKIVKDHFKTAELASFMTVRDVIKKEPGYIGNRTIRFKSSVCRAVLIDVGKSQSEEIRILAETADKISDQTSYNQDSDSSNF